MPQIVLIYVNTRPPPTIHLDKWDGNATNDHKYGLLKAVETCVSGSEGSSDPCDGNDPADCTGNCKINLRYDLSTLPSEKPCNRKTGNYENNIFCVHGYFEPGYDPNYNNPGSSSDLECTPCMTTRIYKNNDIDNLEDRRISGFTPDYIRINRTLSQNEMMKNFENYDPLDPKNVDGQGNIKNREFCSYNIYHNSEDRICSTISSSIWIMFKKITKSLPQPEKHCIIQIKT